MGVWSPSGPSSPQPDTGRLARDYWHWTTDTWLLTRDYIDTGLLTRDYMTRDYMTRDCWHRTTVTNYCHNNRSDYWIWRYHITPLYATQDFCRPVISVLYRKWNRKHNTNWDGKWMLLNSRFPLLSDLELKIC